MTALARFCRVVLSTCTALPSTGGSALRRLDAGRLLRYPGRQRPVEIVRPNMQIDASLQCMIQALLVVLGYMQTNLVMNPRVQTNYP